MNKIRMILADDETVILNGIQKLVDWNALGIEIVGVFEDGRSAFEGIVRLKPDIALLDISMPKMTGIDILKEIHSMEIGTNIIFISGFQDFNYAKSAVKYGAVDYLLKPVIREELMAAIEKCVFSKRPAAETTEEKTNKLDTDLSSLIELEETNYVPVLCAISYPKECQEQMVQLIKFSFQCAINNFLDRNGLGISFERNNNSNFALE